MAIETEMIEIDRETEREIKREEAKQPNAICRLLGLTNNCKKAVLYSSKLECRLFVWTLRCLQGIIHF